MKSVRSNKFAKLIQKELSVIFQRSGTLFFGQAFVTITQVITSPDLSIAKVYLSFLGTPDAGKIVLGMKGHAKEIRKLLGNRIKNQVRHIPELVFLLDDSLEYAMKIDQLLKEVNKSKQ